MKIAVLGAGAMGCLYGGMLAEAGHQVVFVDIRRKQVEALNRIGLEIETANRTRRITNIRAVSDPAEAGRVELVLVFVKAVHTELAMQNARGLIGENTVILTLQNGLGNIEKLNAVAGQARVVAGTSGHGSTSLQAGRIRHAGIGNTVIGEQNGAHSERIKTLAALFNHAGITTEISENITGLIWTKLIVNVGINALTALSGLRNGQLLDYPESQALMQSAIEEACNVAQAKGFRFEVEDLAEYTRNIALKTAQNRSSMLQDVLAKRRTEISVINGAVAEQGESLGIAVPVNRILTDLLLLKEKAYLSAENN